MNELLPCPFCGSTHILVKKRKTTMVECSVCGVVVFDYQNGVQRDPIAAWNLRADSNSVAVSAGEIVGEMIAELRRAEEKRKQELAALPPGTCATCMGGKAISEASRASA